MSLSLCVSVLFYELSPGVVLISSVSSGRAKVAKSNSAQQLDYANVWGTGGIY